MQTLKYYIIWLAVCLYATVSTAQVMPEKTLQQAKKAIVLLKTHHKTGQVRITTGFMIDENGTCITDEDNLKNSIFGSVITADGTEYEIDRIVATHQKYSTAKFTLKNTGGKKFPFLNFAAEPPASGARFATFIYENDKYEPLYAEGIVHQRYTSRYSEQEVLRLSTLPATFDIGGCPLLNARGEVMGIVRYETEGSFYGEANATADQWITTDRTLLAFNRNTIFPIYQSPELEPNLLYYAIELAPDATYVYAAYTNTSIYYQNFSIWNEKDKKQFGFYIKDLQTEQMYFLKGSSIMTNEDNKRTRVEACESHFFRMTFPPLPQGVAEIALIEGSLQEWNLPRIALKPQNMSALRIIAEYEYRARDYIGFLGKGKSNYYTQQLQQLAKEFPAKKELLVNGQACAIIDSYQTSSDIDEAVRLLEDFTREYPQASDDTWLNLHRLYYWQEDFNKALNAITKVIDMTQGPRLHEWYETRARLNMGELKDYAAAYKDWDALAKTFYSASKLPQWIPTMFKMHCAYEMGDPSLAKKHYYEAKEQIATWEKEKETTVSENVTAFMQEHAESLGISK